MAGRLGQGPIDWSSPATPIGPTEPDAPEPPPSGRKAR
jgi:hypothetical protein